MIRFYQCKICESKNIFSLKKYSVSLELSGEWQGVFRDILHQKEGFILPLYICLECGFVFYGKIFDFGEMKQFYELENRFGKLQERSGIKPGRKIEVARLMSFYEKNIDFTAVKTLLDVGAGDFIVCDVFRERHPDVAYTAIDPSFTQSEYRGARVLHTMVEDLDPKEQYDFLMLVHILEHVGELNVFMKKIRELAKGMIYVEVPFQLGPGLFFNRAVNTQHINYFSPATITRLLVQHGFLVQALEFDKTAYRYNGMPGMIRVLAEKRDIPPKEGFDLGGVLENIYYVVSPFIYFSAVGTSRLKSLFRRVWH